MTVLGSGSRAPPGGERRDRQAGRVSYLCPSLPAVSGNLPASDGHAAIAGVVTGVVGFTSSFAVVLTGLRAVGASSAQAGSGLLVLCVTMGLGCVLFSWRLRMPVTMAWSTPGAALLTSAALPAGGFPAAVGAFILAGLLLALTGLIRPLGRLIESIPTPLAHAMLAGVLLSLCVAPFRSLVAAPAAVAPVVIAWFVLTLLARRWAVPGALVVAIVVMAVTGVFGQLSAAAFMPRVEWVTPVMDPAALAAVGLPLYIVTMTSQNIPGIAVLGSFGYRPGMRAPLLYTGGATAVGALGGAHAINLAAISAALAAGPSAHPDQSRRWIAGVSCGLTYLLFGPLSAGVTAMASAAPEGLIESIAGLALIATFAASAAGALAAEATRESAAITFLVAASGATVAGIGSAFWGLVIGVGWLLLTRRLGAR